MTKHKHDNGVPDSVILDACSQDKSSKNHSELSSHVKKKSPGLLHHCCKNEHVICLCFGKLYVKKEISLQDEAH